MSRTTQRPLDAGALQRSFGTLAIDLQQKQRAKIDNDNESRLAETQQQYRATLEGTAQPFPVWTAVTVPFGETFYRADSQRDVPFSDPMFTQGSLVATPDPVIVVSHVYQWIQDEQGNTTGAVVRIGVFDPSAPVEGRRFRAQAHLVFQGYSAPDDETADDDPPEV